MLQVTGEFWSIFDHLSQGEELVFTAGSPEQWELVLELAGRRTDSLLSWEAAPFLSLHLTAVWGRVWRQHIPLRSGKREEGIWKVWEQSALLFSWIHALLFLCSQWEEIELAKLHQTSAAIRMVRCYKSRTYKKPETGVFGHQTP